MTRLLLYIIIPAIVMLPSKPAHALMLKVPFDELVKSSTCIVDGTVVKIESKWTQDGRAIYTDVTVSKRREFKGMTSTQEIVVRIPGGVVDKVGMVVEDMPRFTLGEQVILFLAHDGADYTVTGLYQGKYTVANGIVVEARLPESAFATKITDTVHMQQR